MTRPDDPPDLSGFGAFSLLHPLDGGHRNAVWCAARGDARFVAKSSRRSAAALAWLVPVQQLARDAGFVVPKMLQAADGSYLSAGWTLEGFVTGQAAQPGDLDRLAGRIADMHRRGVGIGQRPGFCSARELLGQTRGGDVDLSALPPALATRCRAAWADLTGVETCIHADLAVGNVIITPKGPALIDWDEARRDLPVFDLSPQDAASHNARMAWEIACSWLMEPDRASALALTWATSSP